MVLIFTCFQVPVLHVDGTLTVATPKVVSLSCTLYISKQALFDVEDGSVQFTDAIYVYVTVPIIPSFVPTFL
jgi:hypothetical protein